MCACSPDHKGRIKSWGSPRARMSARRPGSYEGYGERSHKTAELPPTKGYLIPCGLRLGLSRRCAADFGTVGAFCGGLGFATVTLDGLGLLLAFLSRRWRLCGLVLGALTTYGWLGALAAGWV